MFTYNIVKTLKFADPELQLLSTIKDPEPDVSSLFFSPSFNTSQDVLLRTWWIRNVSHTLIAEIRKIDQCESRM
ncbi:hypothetical protein ACHAPF_008289 [Botrytis cinerea]